MQKEIAKIALMLTIGTFILVMTGCEKQTDCCTIIDVDVQILYKNELGEDLINSNADFEASNIKVYYKNGDEFEYIYNGNLDSPNMHRLDKESGDLVLTVFPSNFYEGNQSTTLIELNQHIVDTLVCEFELGNNREVCKRAWLNGVEFDDRFIEVEK